MKSWLPHQDEFIIQADGCYLEHYGFIDVNSQPILGCEFPWEQEINLYGTVLHEQDKYRMWYQVINRSEKLYRQFTTGVAYAESVDGIHWSKPLIGKTHPEHGPTNILICSHGIADFCSPSVIKTKDNSYIMIFFDARPQQANQKLKTKKTDGWTPIVGEGIFMATSKNGINWDIKPNPIITSPSDACSITQLQNNNLFLTFKTSTHPSRHVRKIAASTSQDMGKTWSTPKVILEPSVHDKFGTEFYSLTPFIQHNQLFGFLNVYRNCKNDRGIHIELAAANINTPFKWKRIMPDTSLIHHLSSNAWGSGRQYSPNGIIYNNELGNTLFYGGCSNSHDDRREIFRGIGVTHNHSKYLMGLKADNRWGYLKLKTPTYNKLEIVTKGNNNSLIQFFNRQNRSWVSIEPTSKDCHRYALNQPPLNTNHLEIKFRDLTIEEIIFR